MPAVAEPKQEQASVLEFDLSPKQGEALGTLCSTDYDELLYGGAKGGGKSVFGVYWCYFMAKQIIKEFRLEPTKYPLVIGFMGRKQGVDFRDTTLETWKKYIPTEAYSIKTQDKLIVIDDTVAIRYGGLDETDEKGVKKFNSAEFAFYFLDQAEECSEQDIGLVRGTLRLKINGRELYYKGLLTANPAICWLKDGFIDHPQPRTKFIQALPSDNPFLAESYIDQLKKAFSFRPELLKAYLYGSWDELDKSNVIIKLANVKKNVLNEQHNKTEIRKIVVCDPADEGADETVIKVFENTKVIETKISGQMELMESAGVIQGLTTKHEANLICIDRIGEGSGLFKHLIQVYASEHSGVQVIGFDSRLKAADEATFVNQKAEAWWMASKMFHESKCNIPADPILVDQLSKVTYTFRNGKIMVTPKEKLRKIFKGLSPDRADCYIMGLWALPLAMPVKKIDPYSVQSEEDEEYPFNSETC